MTLSKKSSVALACVAIVIVAVACNGDDEPSSSVQPGSPVTIGEGRVIDLATSEAAMTILGADTGDLRSDIPALASGDFNDDGIDDILVGARHGDGPNNEREEAGEAYVIFGSQELPETVDIAAGDQDLTIWGANSGDNLGFAAAAADINGDGVDDLLLGAPFARGLTDPRLQTGNVYIIFGRSGLKGSMDLAEDTPDVALIGTGSRSFFGDSLASGDLNGDGIQDLIIGATFGSHSASPSTPAIRGGAVYVMFGASRFPSTLDTSQGEYDVAIFGADDLDELGDNVASGDLNDDGFDDIIMTAEAADGPDNSRLLAAEVYVLFGSERLGGDFEIAPGDQDLTILGADAQDTLGFSLAVGDLQGDGIDDLVMGARLDDGPNNALNTVGAVYMLPGGRGLPPIIDLAQQPEMVSGWHSVDDVDLMSTVVTADLDRDGKNELLIGAGFGDGPGNDRLDAGEVYILDASTASGLKSIQRTPLAVSVFGAQASDGLGAAIATGDVNGDGRLELLLIAADADGTMEKAGRVYVLSLE